ncbi:hypothetical protein [Sphingomonas sp. MMS24-J13]|uniref:hypothetical protein n=1 Tax=Sphingomonas sp. MMS24-J13 TaxID=3238686 RepID=UPI00384D2C9A
MAKAERLERLEILRTELEADYLAALIAALQMTAAGGRGLFDHDQDRRTRAKIAPVVDNLAEMGEAIDNARETLGLEPFELHRQFLASRGPVASSAVGEPKQARAWLEKLGAPVQPGSL